MRSPLEHEPELVAGVGLITVRWAALEIELSKLLGTLMLQSTAGERIYYSVGNFSQRMEIVKGTVIGSLGDQHHVAIVDALFKKIARLWKKRNYLVHSHYVYVAKYKDGGHFAEIGVGNSLGPHPDTLGESPIQIRVHGVEEPERRIVARGFAYQKQKDGITDLVLVNKGTFESHARKVHRRGRQVALLAKSIGNGRAPIICSASAVRATSKYKRP